VIAPNFKRRLSGVTSTIIQLVPEQRRQGIAVATLGATDVGAFSELIDHGATGFLVHDLSAASIGTAVAHIVEDEALRTKMGKAARFQCERHFALAGEARKLGEVYLRAAFDQSEST
jgi:glycosyltransferase involved in cell wall biosynthesis